MYDESEAAQAYDGERAAAYDQDDTTPTDASEDEQTGADSGGDEQEHYYGNSTGDLLAKHIENTGYGEDPLVTAGQTIVEDILETAWRSYSESGDSGSGESEEQ